MIRKSFHVLLACLIAAPLGAGGLCCCLLGGATHEAAGSVSAAAAAAGSCCASESAPIAPAPEPGPGRHCPVDGSEEDCACPTRDLAVVAQAGFASELLAPLPLLDLAGVPSADPTVADPPSAPSTRRHPDPPPKIPLYRTFSVLRC